MPITKAIMKNVRELVFIISLFIANGDGIVIRLEPEQKLLFYTEGGCLKTEILFGTGKLRHNCPDGIQVLQGFGAKEYPLLHLGA